MTDPIVVVCFIISIYSLLRMGFSFAESNGWSIIDSMVAFCFAVVVTVLRVYPNG